MWHVVDIGDVLPRNNPPLPPTPQDCALRLSADNWLAVSSWFMGFSRSSYRSAMAVVNRFNTSDLDPDTPVQVRVHIQDWPFLLLFLALQRVRVVNTGQPLTVPTTVGERSEDHVLPVYVVGPTSHRVDDATLKLVRDRWERSRHGEVAASDQARVATGDLLAALGAAPWEDPDPADVPALDAVVLRRGGWDVTNVATPGAPAEEYPVTSVVVAVLPGAWSVMLAWVGTLDPQRADQAAAWRADVEPDGVMVLVRASAVKPLRKWMRQRGYAVLDTPLVDPNGRPIVALDALVVE